MSNQTTLTIGEVAERYSVSKITIARWAKEGAIPAPVRIGRRMVRWYASVLDEFDRLLLANGDTDLLDRLRAIDEPRRETTTA